MSGVLKIEIQESLDSLKKLLSKQKTGKSKERLQVLYWLKSGQAKTVDELASLSGHHRTTVSRWLTLYRKAATYLFESTWKRKYTTRGIHKLLAKYAEAAGLEKPISPHQLRHFLLTWLKKQGIDDALIQPYSGHSSRQSLEVYSRLSIGEAQEVYNQVMVKFPV